MSEKEKNCNCHHDHDCDCGCEEGNIVTLYADDGREVKVRYIYTVERDGKKYAAFEPIEESEDAGVYIYQLIEKDDGFEIVAVEDEKLLDEVFNQLCDELDAEDDCDCDCEDDDCDCHHDHDCDCGCHNKK